MSFRLRSFILPVCLLLVGAVAYLLVDFARTGRMPFLAAAPTPAPLAPPPSGPTPTPSPAPFETTVFAPMHPACVTARIPVLMYHDITKERGKGSVWYDCTVEEFKKQLDWLQEQGASFLSLEQLHRHLTRGEAVPAQSVVLTFDDNYQGFFDNAYPILKERNIPSAMFVHTNFVGNKTKARPNMDWETLKKLDAGGLVTIGSHTLSHPDDIATRPIEEQDRELADSKAILEQNLGHAIPYFAYPNGKGDSQTFEAARRAGYTMAFTTSQGPVEESPGILILNRYVHTKMEQAWKAAREAEMRAPAVVFERRITETPVMLQAGTYEGIRLAMVRGGRPLSCRATTSGRMSVGEFVRDFQGVAGMNGTFFVNANLRSTDNAMIGPFRAQTEGVFYPDTDPNRLPKLLNRPLVLWGAESLAIVPFHPGSMNEEAGLQALMPDVADCFLAGAWIVHDGVARTREEMGAYAARDFNDPRKRAFFGITDSGDIVLGASRDVITTETLARGVAAAGIREAVLMDSGFSTSLVFDGKIIATGHTAKDLPSRIVPHAIVLRGTLEDPTDPALVDLMGRADPAVGAIPAAQAQMEAPRPAAGRRRRRHR